MASGLTRGQVAKQACVHVETLRYYEQRGLVPEPPRRASGYRIYPPETIQRLRFIAEAKALGFTLQEIGALLDLVDAKVATCDTTIPLVEDKLAAVDAQIARLTSIKHRLLALKKQCRPDDDTCFIQELYDDKVNDDDQARSTSNL